MNILTPILIQGLLTAQPLAFPATDPALNACISYETRRWLKGEFNRATAGDIIWTLCNAEWRNAKLKASMSTSMFTPRDETDRALKELERKYRAKIEEQIDIELRLIRPVP